MAVIPTDDPSVRLATLATTADAAELVARLPAALGELARAGHEEGLVELGAGIARAGHPGLDRTLLALSVSPVIGAAALLVLAGYWHAIDRVDPRVYLELVGELRAGSPAWRGDQAVGLAGITALAALCVHDDRGVDPVVARAARLALVEGVADTSPYLRGLADRLRAQQLRG